MTELRRRLYVDPFTLDYCCANCNAHVLYRNEELPTIPVIQGELPTYDDLIKLKEDTLASLDNQ